VAFGRTEGNLDFPFVDEDGAWGMRLVADHLVNLGHQRIACIASPPELMFSRYRLDGLRSRLREIHTLLDQTLIRIGDLTQRSGYENALDFGAMSAAQSRGLVVGSDVSITGFDNIPMAAHSHPPLTTVSQPIYQIGSMVCEMLVKCVKGESLEQRQVLLQPELNMRESSGQAKAN
jgi:LacI family transcriptional regulator